MIREHAGKWSSSKISRETAQKIIIKLNPIIKKYTTRSEIAGSYRRFKAEMGDLDFVVLKANLKGLLQDIDKQFEVLQIPQDGETILTVVIEFEGQDVQIQFNNCLNEKLWGAAMLHSTGSGLFNKNMRIHAMKRGYKLSQKGLTKDGKLIAGETEQDIFKALGLEYVMPNNRSVETKFKEDFEPDKKQKKLKPGKVKLGFVGTQNGMTKKQIIDFVKVVKVLKPMIFVHDDTIGAASQAHDLIRKYAPKAKIACFPPSNDKKRAHKEVDKEFPASGGLERLKPIVFKTDALAAAPKTKQPEQYSGTWVAVNMAKGANKQVFLLLP